MEVLVEEKNSISQHTDINEIVCGAEPDPSLKQAWAIAAEIAAEKGCKLYDMFIKGQGRDRKLSVFIDKPGDGISLEDCTNVSRALNLQFDIEDCIPGDSYHLEVSSPGLQRNLSRVWHFQTVIGQEISIKTKAPLAEWASKETQWGLRKQAEGYLRGIEDKLLVLEIEKIEVKVPFDKIERAKVIFRFTESELKPVPSKRKKKQKKR